MKPHIIYVITGRCGEYSDRAEWNVCWRHTEEEAKAVVEQLTKEAAVTKDDFYDIAAFRKEATDPYFMTDYTGTEYRYEALADDARGFEEEKRNRD